MPTKKTKTYAKQTDVYRREWLFLHDPLPLWRDEIMATAPETFTLIELVRGGLPHAVKIWAVTRLMPPALCADFAVGLNVDPGIPMDVSERAARQVGRARQAGGIKGGFFAAQAVRDEQIRRLTELLGY